MNLLDLQEGDKAVIESVMDKELAFLLISKGVRIGMQFELTRKVVFGSSLYLKFKNHNMAFRNNEAALIQVKKL